MTPRHATIARLSTLILVGGLVIGPACASSSEAPTASAAEESVKPGCNESFLAEDLDVDSYVDRFEGESREVAVLRDEIVAALDLQAGMSVADIGAGTGLNLAPLAAAVGPGGKVWAVDISPRFITHLEQRIADEHLTWAEALLCDERSAELPEASVDRILICDTYHHFEYPRSTLASLHAALRPGGQLLLIDFERIPGVTRDWLLDHVRAGKDVFRSEIEEAGFEFVEEVEIDGLVENYVLRFERR